MIDFSKVDLDESTKIELAKLNLNYVFQPIFKSDGREIYAYEALMRPVEKTVVELIEEYTKLGKLHYLEVATFFGAVQAYLERGYEEYLAINSFPSESFTEEENRVFDAYFKELHNRGIIEILEYPEIDKREWMKKKSTIEAKNLKIAIDDFGNGNNNTLEVVDIFNPHIVKLDRKLISNIDNDKIKKADFSVLVEKFHNRDMLVLAEGVETKEEFDYLSSHGVDLLQGYYLGRPQ